MCSSWIHVCIEYVVCCLFGTQRYPPTHTTGDNICLWNNQQFINSFASLNMYTSTNLLRSLGVSIWASVRFLLDSSRLHILSVNSIWTACEFNNRMEISQNAETFNHLALLTMLSALRHGWGMLALCCGEIERYFMKLDSQPKLVLPNIRNKNRATVADDRARCDTPKNLCIVLILPLAALKITYGKRISSNACLYTAFKWNSCSQ